MKLNMKYIKSFNENLNQSFNYSDKEITEFRSNFNGVEQPSYWTKGNNAKGKFTLEELFNEFNSK
jgi:hypothetical protein